MLLYHSLCMLRMTLALIQGVLCLLAQPMMLCRAGLTETDVAAEMDKRAEARKAKDYAAADAVRAELSKKGIAIMDTPQGVEWRPTTPQL